MSDYTLVGWTDGVTPENAATLGQMDQGILDAHDKADSALDANPPDPTGQEGKWLKVEGGAMVWATMEAGSSIEYENAWGAGVAYTPGDVVQHNGIDYLAVNPSTGQEPPLAFGIVDFMSARVFRSVVQSIGAGGSVVIPFDTEQFDDHNMWLSGDPTRLTVPSGGDGIWLVGAHSAFSATAAGDMTGYLRKNGNDIAVGASNSTGSADVSNTNVQTVINAVAGDYFEFRIRNVSAASRNTSVNVPPTLYAARLG